MPLDRGSGNLRAVLPAIGQAFHRLPEVRGQRQLSAYSCSSHMAKETGCQFDRASLPLTPERGFATGGLDKRTDRFGDNEAVPMRIRKRLVKLGTEFPHVFVAHLSRPLQAPFGKLADPFRLRFVGGKAQLEQ